MVVILSERQRSIRILQGNRGEIMNTLFGIAITILITVPIAYILMLFSANEPFYKWWNKK